MTAPSPLIYIIGLIVLTLLGIIGGLIGRTFLAGVREQVVKAVVNTAMGALLGAIQTGVQDLKDDMKLVKAGLLSSSQASLLTNSDLSAIRARLEDHLAADETWQHKVEEFMDWVSDYLKNHTHPGAPVAPPLT